MSSAGNVTLLPRGVDNGELVIRTSYSGNILRVKIMISTGSAPNPQ